MNVEKKQERNSCIEVLRILSMLAIIATHYVEINYLDYLDVSVITFNRVFLEFMRAGAKIGVNIFVLITGYFLIDREFRWKRIMKLSGTVWFYSIVLDAISYMLGYRELTLKNLADTCFPILMQKHWFVTVFMGLELIFPFLNKGLKALNRKEHFRLILLLLFMTSVIPTFTAQQYFYSNFLWFIVLYCIAAYIRLYPGGHSYSYRLLLAGGAEFLLILLSIFVFDCLGLRYPSLLQHRFYFTTMNTILTALCAVSIFGFAVQLRPTHSRLVNKMGSAMFAVYLIHCSEIGRAVWRYVLKPLPLDSLYLPAAAVFSVIAMMIFCVAVERVRQIAGEKLADCRKVLKKRDV